MTDKQIAGYCDDIKETALRQFYKVQNQRKEISLLHKKCARQQAEIERLKDEVSVSRRKALLEASEKFAGHSDYHGDTILGKLICMAEGKEVGEARPLDKNEIKTEAIKEYIKTCEKTAISNAAKVAKAILLEMAGEDK